MIRGKWKEQVIHLIEPYVLPNHVSPNIISNKKKTHRQNRAGLGAGRLSGEMFAGAVEYWHQWEGVS